MSDIQILKDFEFPDAENCRGVHSVLESLFPQFDREGISKRVASREGRSQAEVLAEWSAKGEISRQNGLKLHEYIARILLGDKPDGFEALALDAPCLQFNTFWDRVSDGMTPVWVEQDIRDPELGLSGRVDALVYNEVEETCHLVDWKYGEFKTKIWNQLNPPFAFLGDNSIGKVSLQLSCYRLIIERMTGVELGSSYAGWFTDHSQYFTRLPCHKRELELWLTR